jgi:CubicO group peptidase (beta-lactamase class C family)
MRIREISSVAILISAFLIGCSAIKTDSRLSKSRAPGADVEEEEILERGAAQSEGFSRDALDAARAELEKRILSGSIAGGAHMVVREGDVVYFHVAGVSDIEDGTPLEADTIVRIYSMTKPITSVAAMKLWEQRKFKLDDPVSKYIPAFEKTSVLVAEGDSTEVVATERPITVRDAFRHTTGYTYGDDESPTSEYYSKVGLRYDSEHGLFPPNMTIAEAADLLAQIPAVHQPGARFTYGFSTDLLGRLVEIWSGMPLDQYMQEAIFTPLEMVDTGFSVPRDQQDRFSSCQKWEGDKHFVADKAASSPYLDGFDFLSGGGGLVSTMQDYANFCQMLVDGGEFNGKQILEPATLELMFTNQLAGVSEDFHFGLGFQISDRELGVGDGKRNAVAYHWGGYANTAFEVIPEEKLFQILMRQSIPFNHDVSNAVFPIVYSGTQ